MPRNILLITTDQMRYDALGCNGGEVARTPNIDNLSATGINYHRAHNQNVVCMPARATIITGQHVGAHGVWMNGVSMPEDRHTIAHHLKENGYNTALLGKAHFEPWLGSPDDFFENRMASLKNTGPHRGFDHMELANHFFEGHSHYDQFMSEHSDYKQRFYPMVTDRGQNTASQGETGALQVWPMDVPRDLYHTQWVADRTKTWIGAQSAEQPWFCWMSFPDPHHPWDVPQSEMHRVNWRDVPLPAAYSENSETLEVWLDAKPKHWRSYYDGSLWSNLESPRDFRPVDLTADQIREINALTHIENELIDEACGDVISFLENKGIIDNTDIFFTTDHGELQGDFGLLFKGPYHIDALMRLPFIWKPAANARVPSAAVKAPVGHVDLAKTFCAIAGIDSPDYCQGQELPTNEAQAEQQAREHITTVWDSEHGPVTMSLRSIYHQSGLLCTAYQACSLYDGSEGELYDMRDDPLQLVNLWDDPSYRVQKEELVAQLNHTVESHGNTRYPRVAPV